MPVTYETVATTTLTTATASVTFSSISGTYTDLVLVCSTKVTAAEYLRFRVGNGSVDTGSNYSQTVLDGNGTTANSYRYSNITRANLFVSTSLSTSNFAVSIAHFNNYANTTTNKTIIHRGNLASGGTEAGVSLWRSTSAINIISVFVETNNLDSGSTFTLYGIKAA